MAGAVPPVLVRSRGCSRTPPGPHESRSSATNEGNTNEGNTNEKQDKEEDDAAQTASVTKEKRNEN